MKIDFKQMMIVAFAWLLSAVLLLWVFSLQSCSDARLAQKHYKKAVKYGYRCDTVLDTITIEKVDSFPIILNDTIVWKYYITKHDTIVKYKTSYIPKTRVELRYDLRRERSRLKHERKVFGTYISSKTKEAVKTARLKERSNPIRQIKGLLVWGVVLVISFFALGWISKK